MLIPLRTDEPTRKAPIITIMLMVANVAAFIYQLASGTGLEVSDAVVMRYGAIPGELIDVINEPALYSRYLSLLTYMFLHGRFIHLLGNMLFLNTFGPNLEDLMGHFKFFVFYILCGVVSALVYILPNFNSANPLVGASGAIAGVMGAHIRALPRTRILCLFFVIRITLPAIAILFPWIILQFYNVSMGGESNVAWIAHIGGFFFGAFLVKKFQSKRLHKVEQHEHY